MLSEYLRGLICMALFVMLAILLTPKGRGKSVVRFVCALAMLTAALLPIGGIDFDAYSELIGGYRADAESFTDAGREDSENLNRLYIQDKCEAYILDKAAELGAEVRSVEVTAEWSDKGWFYPSSVEICADCEESLKKRLSVYIEGELGIEEADQNWRTKDEA